MSMRSPLGRVRGLGSAKEGAAHWWSQRLSAIALLPLSLWFAGSVAFMAGAEHETVRLWVASPVVAGLLVLLIAATFYHTYLGMQVVIEDYVHAEGVKIGMLLSVQGGCLLLGAIAIMSVFSLSFGS